MTLSLRYLSAYQTVNTILPFKAASFSKYVHMHICASLFVDIGRQTVNRQIVSALVRLSYSLAGWPYNFLCICLYVSVVSLSIYLSFSHVKFDIFDFTVALVNNNFLL